MRRCISMSLALLVGLALPVPVRSAPDDESLTPRRLSERLAAEPKGKEAERLAHAIRTWFGGKEKLAEGPKPKIDGLEVAWAIDAPGASAVAVATEDERALPLVRVGTTGVFAATFPLPDGTAFRWTYEVDGKRLGRFSDAPQAGAGRIELFLQNDPASVPHSDVPKGKLTQQPPWKSKVFEGTTRDWWIYVPAQHKDDTPACVMVFQDGKGYTESVPTVFDNLIAKGEMPVTVGIFLQPGTLERGRSNRSFEYDTLSDQYARFLVEEILPEVEKTVKLRHDAQSRAIAGISSGGICAWTVAWEKPDEFSKVLSWVGSFTNIASGKSGHDGGHNYEAMIRKTKPKKPIRVFLQDGANDLDNANGNWPLANQQMAKALQFAGYDYRFVYGQGFHSNVHGRAILPESLRWLWRDYKP